MAVATLESITIDRPTALVRSPSAGLRELEFENWAAFMRHRALGLPIKWSYKQSRGNDYPTVISLQGLPRVQDIGLQQVAVGRRVAMQEVRQRSFRVCQLVKIEHALFFFVQDTRLIRNRDNKSVVLRDTQASKVLVAHKKDSERIAEIIQAGMKMVEDPSIPLRRKINLPPPV